MPKMITLTCDDALRDLLRAIDAWAELVSLPPDLKHATRMGRIALSDKARHIACTRCSGYGIDPA